MESPNDRGDNVLTTHLILPSKTSRARNGLHLVDSLGKRVLWTPQNITGYCHLYWLLSAT